MNWKNATPTCQPPQSIVWTKYAFTLPSRYPVEVEYVSPAIRFANSDLCSYLHMPKIALACNSYKLISQLAEIFQSGSSMQNWCSLECCYVGSIFAELNVFSALFQSPRLAMCCTAFSLEFFLQFCTSGHHQRIIK